MKEEKTNLQVVCFLRHVNSESITYQSTSNHYANNSHVPQNETLFMNGKNKQNELFMNFDTFVPAG